MPTYEYECQKCAHRFEEFQSMNDEPLKKCPQCKGKVKRLIGAGAGFLFKGSGFYTTDYRSAGYSEKKKKDAGAGEGAKAGGGEKSAGDAKSAGAPAAPAAAGKEPKAAPAKGREPKSSQKSKD